MSSRGGEWLLSCHAGILGQRAGFGSASNFPTLNFAKNANFRMDHLPWKIRLKRKLGRGARRGQNELSQI